MQPIISIQNLSKQYRLGTVGTGTLKSDIQRWWALTRGKEDPFARIAETNVRNSKGESDYIWALKDINFDVMPGEILGIIGKNGAGKSTLLKILSKVTGPTKGSIHFNGRIGSLLEVGTGFHPELTGRENIFLNGAILGMTKTEIRSKLGEIVDFSGCERYIDTPVKRYSSGMMVRLGFAVAAHLEPEILVVDEVLAVGDAEFQKKAIGKMQEVSKGGGKTVLFVSHNMSSIRKLCSKGILLNNGIISYEGTIHETIKQYLNVFQSELVPSVIYPLKQKAFQILGASILDKNHQVLNSAVLTSDKIYLEIKYIFTLNFPKVHMTYFINNEEGELILFADRIDYHENYASVQMGCYQTLLEIPNPLLVPGKYSVTLGLAIVDTREDDHKFDALSFEVSDADSNRPYKRQGYVFKPIIWELNKC